MNAKGILHDNAALIWLSAATTQAHQTGRGASCEFVQCVPPDLRNDHKLKAWRLRSQIHVVGAPR